MLPVGIAFTIACFLGMAGGTAAYIALDGTALFGLGADKAKELHREFLTPRSTLSDVQQETPV